MAFSKKGNGNVQKEDAERIITTAGAMIGTAWGSEGWNSLIVLERLDTGHPGNCILGQLKGSHAQGIAWLKEYGASDEQLRAFSPTTNGEHDLFNTVWKESITRWRTHGLVAA